MEKCILILVMILSSIAIAVPATNALIYAPQITGVTIDGDLSDWTSSSGWAVYGGWFERNVTPTNPTNGLASTTQAQFAWNDANDVLYVGIETTEGIGLFLEMGGLMGNVADPNGPIATIQFTEATQMSFSNWMGGTADIASQVPGDITTGVSAAFAFEGATMVIELAIPIYSDWTDSGSAMALHDRMDVYVFSNVFDAAGDLGDSMTTDGEYVAFFSEPMMQVAALVRLLDTNSPEVCADVPDSFKPAYDLDGSCYVDLGDFGLLANAWLECNDPEDEDCVANWPTGITW